MPKDLIKIEFDTSPLTLVEQDGDKFLINPKAEEGWIKVNELKKRIEEIEQKMKEALGKAMDVMNTKKIEGDLIKAIKRVYGSRYEVVDQEIAKTVGIMKEVISYKIDTEVVDKMIEDTGALPEGIKLKDRAEQVTITEIK